mmetsp:Transcript_68615/g.143283  ORF Transcript_68615/g.143283 Transcript_68615/m.143283 type:complete len:99 (+) Transcript_68615:42-338(+)
MEMEWFRKLQRRDSERARCCLYKPSRELWSGGNTSQMQLSQCEKALRFHKPRLTHRSIEQPQTPKNMKCILEKSHHQCWGGQSKVIFACCNPDLLPLD